LTWYLSVRLDLWWRREETYCTMYLCRSVSLSRCRTLRSYTNTEKNADIHPGGGIWGIIPGIRAT